MQKEIEITTSDAVLQGLMSVPKQAKAIVLFAHGSGSGRLSPRNQMVANILNQGGIATLLMDLLTKEEEKVDNLTREFRFDIELLAKRLSDVTDWVRKQPELKSLAIGYFGASTGAAAALLAADLQENQISAIVSRGGRPDLAKPALARIEVPTLLIVGGDDEEVIQLNQYAYGLLAGEKKLEIVPGATHLFEEPGTLEKVAALAVDWFLKHE